MEDKGLFPLLDDLFGGPVEKAALRQEHKRDAAFFQPLEHLADDRTRQHALGAMVRDALAHLKHEEEVMMPLVPKIGGGNEVKAREIFNRRVLAKGTDTENFDWFVGWIVEQLGRVSSSANSDESTPPTTLLRRFLLGLQSGSTPAQYRKWLRVVKDKLKSKDHVWELVNGLKGEFELDGPGKMLPIVHDTL